MNFPKKTEAQLVYIIGLLAMGLFLVLKEIVVPLLRPSGASRLDALEQKVAVNSNRLNNLESWRLKSEDMPADLKVVQEIVKRTEQHVTQIEQKVDQHLSESKKDPRSTSALGPPSRKAPFPRDTSRLLSLVLCMRFLLPT